MNKKIGDIPTTASIKTVKILSEKKKTVYLEQPSKPVLWKKRWKLIEGPAVTNETTLKVAIIYKRRTQTNVEPSEFLQDTNIGVSCIGICL